VDKRISKSRTIVQRARKADYRTNPSELTEFICNWRVAMLQRLINPDKIAEVRLFGGSMSPPIEPVHTPKKPRLDHLQ
jgi:hypothetical protein